MAGEPLFKAEYLSTMKAKTNGYWKQNRNRHIVTISTHTNLHPFLDVSIIKLVADIPRGICN